MRTASHCALLPVLAMVLASTACEKQDQPARSAGQSAPQAPASPASSGTPVPGSSGYYGALSGAKGVAENTVKQADDYNRKLEEQMDDLFTD